MNAPKNNIFELSEVSPADLRKSSLLPSFCKLILDVGNFLNYVRKSQFKKLSQLKKSSSKQFSRDAMTCPYQFPVTTKLSIAIILIKQLNVYVTTVVVILATSEIDHTINITWEVKEIAAFKDVHLIDVWSKNI